MGSIGAVKSTTSNSAVMTKVNNFSLSGKDSPWFTKKEDIDYIRNNFAEVTNTSMLNTSLENYNYTAAVYSPSDNRVELVDIQRDYTRPNPFAAVSKNGKEHPIAEDGSILKYGKKTKLKIYLVPNYNKRVE